LNSGANPNARDDLGLTPLHAAARNGRGEAARLLIDAHADVNALSISGLTPLHDAAEYGRTELVQILVKAGANINAKSKASRTPLHKAAWNGHLEVAKVLLENGVDVDAKTTSVYLCSHSNPITPAQSAEEVARERGKNYFAHYLREWKTCAALWNIWEMDIPLYISHLQWLPQEMLEDVLWLQLNRSTK